jgi:hypothetical protein
MLHGARPKNGDAICARVRIFSGGAELALDKVDCEAKIAAYLCRCPNSLLGVALQSEGL